MIRFLKTFCLNATIAFCLLISVGAHAQLTSEELLTIAWKFESNGEYQSAALAYRDYLASQPAKSVERRYAKIKLPVLQEAINFGNNTDLDLYLSALNSRAAGDIRTALALLDRITAEHPHSNLVDDARYLQAYIAMMDNFEFDLAHDTFQTLRYTDPQSRYYDTALYSEAIAQEQLGNRQLALTKLTELRDRHTGISIAGIAWPRDEYVSRLWFDRSNERLQYLQNHQKTASSLVSLEPYGQYGFAWRAVISVDGYDLNLLLNQSQVTADTRIVDANGSPIRITDTTAFAGRVEGEPDSWARITVSDNNLRGMISVHGKKHSLVPTETGGTLSDFNPLLLGDIDGNISTEPDHALYPPKSNDQFNNYMRSIKLVSEPTFETGTVGLTALIGVVVDSKFNSYHGGRGAEEARAILNTTDGIFREQFGLALQIDTIIVIDSQDTDPMNLGSVTMESMMRNFSEYRKASPDLGGDIAMATLFSGNKNSDSALGLAWIGSACRTDGYDVSVVSPYRLPALLSTHEIAHTLGAQHDSDTACSNDSGNVMWPYLSSSTRRTFSSCSKESVQQVVLVGNCLIDTMDIGIDLSVSATEVIVTTFNYDNTRNTSGSVVRLSTDGLQKLASTPPDCSLENNELVCSVAALAPGASNQLTVGFQTPLTLQENVIAKVQPVGFMDSHPDNNSMSGDINGNTQLLYDSSINNPGLPSGARTGINDNSAAGAFNLTDILFATFMLFSLGYFKRTGKRVKVTHV